jgi:DNA-binding beta-propeller fold protein YncE
VHELEGPVMGRVGGFAWAFLALLVMPFTPASPATAQDYVYVTIQGEAAVAVVSTECLEEVERVDLTALGFSENANPHHVAVEPDGSHWYVSLIGENRVLRFNGANELVDQVEFEVPGLLARTSSGPELYVGRSMMAVNPPVSIGVIDTGTMEISLLDTFFPRPHALAVAPEAGRIFSASLSQNQMASIDPETGALELLNLDGPIHTLVQFAVSPDESILVATTEITGRLLVFGLDDPDRPDLRASIEVGRRPWHPVFEPGAMRVWFALKGDDEVVGVDLIEERVFARISGPSLANPHGAGISPDGRHLFISSNGPGGGMAMDDHEAHDHPPTAPAEARESTARTGTLTIIDLETHQVVKVIELGGNATGVGVRQP